MLQSASIRKPPCGKDKIAPGVRSLTCAGPSLASNLVAAAPGGRIPRELWRRFRIWRGQRGVR
eukprot:8275643-Alexandrium_andersonii.AAC.1